MSGSAGGNRISREDVESTIQHYQDNVLSEYRNYKTSVISGSYNTSNKTDFGDIDLIVELKSNDKIRVKKDFGEFVSSLPDDLIVPFKSVKYNGKKFLSSGEIITILYPIENGNGFVQIDNIISLSSDETNFKLEFLNLPAIKQGLMLGLIKTVVLENPRVLNKFPNLPKPAKNQEYEFNLSSSALTLRRVDLTPDFKTLDSVDIWKTTKWSIVESLLSDYYFNKSFESLVSDIKNNLQNPRSLNRVKGVFRSMVSVKSGEVDTPKGSEKDYALRIIAQL